MPSSQTARAGTTLVRAAARAILPVLFFAYAAFANISLLAERQDWPDAASTALPRSVDALYADALPHRPVAVGTLGALRFALLNEGREGVVGGRDGWLFTAEEARPAQPMPVPMAETVARMVQLRDRLAAQGIALTVLPIPAKIDIARAFAPRNSPAPDARAGDHARFIAALDAAGIPAWDPRPLLQQAPTSAFFTTDTHWRVETAGRVAEALAQSAVIPPGTERFAVRASKAEVFTGDLVTFVTTERFAPLAGLAREKAEPFVAEIRLDLEAGGFDLFASPGAGAVALVGTSYSADPRWSFAEALKLALRRDVVNHADFGRGPVAPMLDFLERVDRGEAMVNSVLWEFPTRYLGDPALWPENAADGIRGDG